MYVFFYITFRYCYSSFQFHGPCVFFFVKFQCQQQRVKIALCSGHLYFLAIWRVCFWKAYKEFVVCMLSVYNKYIHPNERHSRDIALDLMRMDLVDDKKRVQITLSMCVCAFVCATEKERESVCVWIICALKKYFMLLSYKTEVTKTLN